MQDKSYSQSLPEYEQAEQGKKIRNMGMPPLLGPLSLGAFIMALFFAVWHLIMHVSGTHLASWQYILSTIGFSVLAATGTFYILLRKHLATRRKPTDKSFRSIDFPTTSSINWNRCTIGTCGRTRSFTRTGRN